MHVVLVYPDTDTDTKMCNLLHRHLLGILSRVGASAQPNIYNVFLEIFANDAIAH